MSSLFYFFKESLTGFTRNLSTALGSIVTIFLSLLIIGIFLIGGSVVNNVVSSVEDEVSVTAYVADDASDSDVQAAMSYIRGIDGVANVDFTTKDQALENFRATSNSDIIDSLDGNNPLPASIDVELSDPQMVEQVVNDIQGNQAFKKVADNPDNPSDSLKYGEKTVDRLFSLTNYVRYIGVALIVLLIFIALVFINNTIRLAILARRKEIAIMRLVGASNGFIRGPFITEGVIQAIFGSALAIGALELVRNLLMPRLQNSMKFLDMAVSMNLYLVTYGSLVALGVVIGLFGSAIAMRRYLKV